MRLDGSTRVVGSHAVSDAEPSLQQRYAPNNACFGCGPVNEQGLRIGSFPSVDDPDTVICDWQPAVRHEAFPGMLNGGIIGALLDCHMNWAATWHLMRRDGLPAPPCTVTAEFAVTMRRPTPTAGPVHIKARAVESQADRVTVEASLEAGGKTCATGRGTFVAVKPGHPAYHRW